MKRMFFVYIFLLFVNNSVQADCYTGFACSIADLEKNEHEKIIQDIEIYKEYLEENKKEVVFKINTKPVKYKDLFIFNSFV